MDLRLLIFDLDGVLVDFKRQHFDCLNQALVRHDQQPISWEDHLERFDGRPTREKLRMLSEERGLPEHKHEDIDRTKKDLTELALESVPFNPAIHALVAWCRTKGVAVHVASNARRSTVDTALGKVGIGVDAIWDPSHVKRTKPDPEIYLKAMEHARVGPGQTLILEDSPVGRRAARASGAHVLPVFSVADVGVPLVERWLKTGETGLTVVVPMAGSGKRFREAGYADPKPFIRVRGKELLRIAVEGTGHPESPHVFVVRRDMLEECPDLEERIHKICSNSRVAYVDRLTEGAACTVLKGLEGVDPDDRLLLANCDQLTTADPDQFVQSCDGAGADGGIMTFGGSGSKWSYATVAPDTGDVTAVIEKPETVSGGMRATCGLYYWRRAGDFVRHASEMVTADDRVRGEFYVAPVFSWALRSGKRFRTFPSGMAGLGTPEDVEAYLASVSGLPGTPSPAVVVSRVSELGRSDPSLARPRVAVCLSGHVRNYQLCAPTMENVAGDRYDLDFFVHTWSKTGYRGNERQAGVSPDLVRATYGSIKTVIEDLDGGSPEHHMFRKIRACDELRRQHERETGAKYEWVVRCRFDLALREKIPFPEEGSEQVIFIPKGSDHGGTNDQLAWGRPDAMTYYSTCFPEIPFGDRPHPETFLKTYIKDCRVERVDFKYDLVSKVT